MKNIKLGDRVYEGVEIVRLDTAAGGTVDYGPYNETFAAGRTEGYNAGKEAGLEEGFDNGKAAGITEGYAEGKEDGIQSEYDRFWDAFQENGKRTSYAYAFGGQSWSPDTFRPKYDIHAVGSCDRMFAYGSLAYQDLAELLNRRNITMDLSGATSFDTFMQYSGPSRVPEINTTGADELRYMFSSTSLLKTIDNFILREDGSQKFTYTFINCTGLNDLTITGTIGTDINFQWSPLTTDSMKSIITHLKNYSGTADAEKYTVKFMDDCWTALEADSTAPDGNTWRDYVETALGWLT